LLEDIMTNDRPLFRFGVVVERAQSRNEWIAKARRAEELGYATFLVPDHIDKDIAPLVALTIAAEATTTIRVGSFVFDNDLRHPAILAKEVATLDMLSGGRFELGLGGGYLQTDYTQTGIPFDAPAVRISRFEEALHIIKKLFTEETVTFSGQYYTITDMRGIPRPVQRPHPPIYVGGGGKRVLSIAAQEADIVGFVPRNSRTGLNMKNATAQATLQKLEWVRATAGERFHQLELSSMVFLVIVSEDRSHTAQHVAGRFGLSAEQVLTSPQMLIGTISQISEDLQARREQFGISYIEVLEENMEKFAPVVAHLAGK
jgi:probable F420-dependent oxidoreductase